MVPGMADSTGRCLPLLSAAGSNCAELNLLISFTNALQQKDEGEAASIKGANKILCMSLCETGALTFCM